MELPSHSSEGIIAPKWTFKENRIAFLNMTLAGNHFEGRISVDPDNFNLIVRNVTLQDSGPFTFTSAQGSKQREPVCFLLQVHGETRPEFSVNKTGFVPNVLVSVLLYSSIITTTTISISIISCICVSPCFAHWNWSHET